MAEAFIVAREADLWNLLEVALEGSNSLTEISSIRIKGWKPRLLYFPDEKIGHSISPSLAKSIAGFHNSLSRSYAYARYGQADGRLLRLDDTEVLDFRMLVIQGSNGIQVLDGALDRLTRAIISKVTGKQMAMLIALFLLLNFGETTMKDWLHEEYAAKAQTDERANALALSQQETKRMEVLASALERNPAYNPMSSIAEEGRVPLLRGTLAYERSNVLGTPLTRDQASVIVSKEKAKGIGQRLDGCFEVVDINVDNPEGHNGILRDTKTGQDIRVAINWGELTQTDVDALVTALRNKTCVDALVNAWVVGGKISYAAVLRADASK